METGTKTTKLYINGMTCVNCQNKIQKKLSNTAGIKKAEVGYSDGAAIITYDKDIISPDDIAGIVERLGYEAQARKRSDSSNLHRAIGALVLIFALYLLLREFGVTEIFNIFPTAEAGMGYGTLLLIGFMTSFHCVAMCGGINLSQCLPSSCNGNECENRQGKLSSLKPSFLYNLGRVISYTLIGGIVGAVGAAIAPTGAFRGVVQLLAGVFMMLMGINMLGIFPWLRRFTPRLPRSLAGKINYVRGRGNGPLYVGLLNGFMPCGPLQAMQLYALYTGNPVEGALSMLAFSLGTVPLMFGLGALSQLLSRRFARNAMSFGAVLVVVLGFSMFLQGYSLSGFVTPSGVQAATASGVSGASSVSGVSGAVTENGVQIINSTLSGRRYPAITVQAGVPVKWIIDAPAGSINGCNYRMVIREYGVEYQFNEGENVIEFTPTETGVFPYSCWMGMIRSSITVVDAGAEQTASEITEETTEDLAIPEFPLAGPSCCN